MGGLPLEVVLICSVTDALFAAKELDAVLSNQLPAAHQPAMDSLFLTGLLLFLACDAIVAVWLARILIFAVAPASKPSICYVAVL